MVKVILSKFPELGMKVDQNKDSGLHKACLNGHEEIAAVLLSIHPNLARKFNNLGYLPIHLVAISGRSTIFRVFMDLAPMSFMDRTKQGQPILHLTIQYNQYDAFLCFLNYFRGTNNFYSVDLDGNSPLHVAVLRSRTQVTCF